MAYESRTDWKDLPDESTPVRSSDIIRWENGIAEAHDAIEALPAPTPAPTVDTLSGATAVGKSVMKATSAAAARTAIGAGEPVTLPTADTLGGATDVGKSVIKAADAAAARAAIGAGTPVTIPSALTAAEAQAGTATTTRTISAKVLADEIDRRVAAAIAAIPPAGE